MAQRTFRIAFALEWTLVLRNRAIWAVLILLVALAGLAAVNGHERVAAMRMLVAGLNRDEVQTQTALKGSVARWEASRQGEPPTVANPGTVGFSLLSHYAALPPMPLAALAVGQSDVLPSYYRVTANPTYTFLAAGEISNPLNALSGSFDFAFVIVFILPIVIVAITFDLVSREKEMGVIGLVAASGASLTRVILAKAAARGVILAAALVLITLEALTLGVDGPPDVLAGLLWFVAVTVYAVFWFVLALAVNSTNRPSVTNGVILANIWLVLVVVTPAFIGTAANALYPAPSRVALTTEMREAAEEADKAAASSREAYFFDHPELAGKGANPDGFYVQVLATNAAVERAVSPLLTEFDDQARKREGIVAALKFLSPALLVDNALTVLAGTDGVRFSGFVRQVVEFHRFWRQFFETRIVDGTDMTARSFDQIPTFQYQSNDNSLIAVSLPLAALALLASILLMVAMRRLARYPVV